MTTYADGRQDMSVDVESSLMYSRGQCRVEALGESLGDDELVRDDGELWCSLKTLLTEKLGSACYRDVRSSEKAASCAHFEELGEEGDEVGPFIDLVERLERLVHGRGVLAVLGIALQSCMTREESQDGAAWGSVWGKSDIKDESDRD